MVSGMKKNIFITFIFFFIFIGFIKINVFGAGSGAYRIEAPDAGPMGMGSAFVAQADRPSAVYYNPAGLIQLKDKRYVVLGTAVIQPFSQHTSLSGEVTKRRRQRFVIPHFYYVDDFGMDNFSFGLGAGSYWGLGTHWAEDSFSRYQATKSDMQSKDVSLAGAFKFNNKFSIGVSLDYDYAYVNKKKKLQQTPFSDGDFQLKGRDNDNWGYRVSLLYKLNQRHSFGIMYRSPIHVKYRGRIYLNHLEDSPSPLVPDYNAIFGGASYDTRVISESTLPQSIVAGYAYKPNDRWTFEADIEWMDWASTEQELILYPDETDATRLAILNNGNPAAKDWKDAFSGAIGAQFKASDRLRLRAGYYYHQSPIPEANFETALPDSDSHSATIGCGYDFNQSSTIDFAYSAMFYEKRDVDTNAAAGIDGEYETFTNIYMLTFTYKY